MQKTRREVGRFGSHEAITEYAKAHFVDLREVTIPTTPVDDRSGCGMVLHFAGNYLESLSRADAESLLNDGVLSRRGIPIKLA